MPDELIITIETDNTVIATLEQDGEFHEENYGIMSNKAISKLIEHIEEETKLKANVIVVQGEHYG